MNEIKFPEMLQSLNLPCWWRALLTCRLSQVPVGGCYRLVDTPISYCVNSGINKIFLLTQFNSDSLNRHLVWTYYGAGWFRGGSDAKRRQTYRHCAYCTG